MLYIVLHPSPHLWLDYSSNSFRDPSPHRPLIGLSQASAAFATKRTAPFSETATNRLVARVLRHCPNL